MKKPILIFFLSFSGIHLAAQTNLDSLLYVWQDETQPDPDRANAYYDYIWDGFLFSDPETAFTLAQTLASYGEEKQFETIQLRKGQ